MTIKSEHAIENEIMLALSECGNKVFRSNAGKIRTQEGRTVILFPPGFPDICGWRGSDGKFFAIEIKNERGRLRDSQKRFREMVKYEPILYGVARSVKDAIEIVEEKDNGTEQKN